MLKTCFAYVCIHTKYYISNIVGYFYKNQDLFTLPELLNSPPVAHHISFLCYAALRFAGFCFILFCFVCLFCFVLFFCLVCLFVLFCFVFLLSLFVCLLVCLFVFSCFLFFVFCLSFFFYFPNAANVSGLFIPHCAFGFL